MSVPPPPPPPPPPSASIKGPIPVTNKALLTSIQKGTKLKKVPESAKNDRSEASLSTKPTSNGPQTRTANCAPPSAQNMSTRQQPQPMKPFNDIQSELANHISLNLRKSSMPAPASNPPPIRPVSKSNVPSPNQFNSINKPPPPPPVNKKPMLRSSTTEITRPVSELSNNIDKPFVQPPVKKIQPPIPTQLKQRPPSSVSRSTAVPPPPIPNVVREAPKPPITNQPPPPVPHRVMVPPQNGHPSNPNRVQSLNENQYKLLDRAPPPPPPMNNPINISTQKSSKFENRFRFPEEKYFPPPENSRKLETRSY